MKQPNIKKEIRSEANKYTPDALDRIKLAAQNQNLLPRQNDYSIDYANGCAKSKSKIKGKIIPIVSSCAAFVMAIILLIAFLLNGGSTSIIPPLHIALSKDNAYGLGAVSTVKLLGGNLPTTALDTLSATAKKMSGNGNKSGNSQIDDDILEQLDKFNIYFSAFDYFLGDEILNTETVDNSDDTYRYEKKMTIKGLDFDGDQVVYYMYYTEVEVAVNSQNSAKNSAKALTHNSEDYKEHEKDDNDGVTYDKLYSLDGVMLIDNNVYHIDGERCSEVGGRESELKITAYADIKDKSSFIRMEQGTSMGGGETETDYIYSVYKDGKLVEKTIVDFETEVKNGKKEIECGIDFITDGKIKGSYGIKREVNNGKVEIKVSYNLNGNKGSFAICEKKNSKGEKCFEYNFSNKYKCEKKAH